MAISGITLTKVLISLMQTMYGNISIHKFLFTSAFCSGQSTEITAKNNYNYINFVRF